MIYSLLTTTTKPKIKNTCRNIRDTTLDLGEMSNAIGLRADVANRVTALGLQTKPNEPYDPII